MPSVARMLALVIVLAGATGLAAQAYGQGAAAGGRSANLAASPAWRSQPAWPPTTPVPQLQARQLVARPESVDTSGATAGLSSSVGDGAGQANGDALPFGSAGTQDYRQLTGAALERAQPFAASDASGPSKALLLRSSGTGEPAQVPASVPMRQQPVSSDTTGYAEIAQPANPALQPATGANPVVPVVYEAPGSGQPTTELGQAASSPPVTSTSVPLSPPAARPSLRLSPPRRSGAGDPVRPGGLPSVVTIGGSLAVVLGIFFFVAWLMRRVTPAQSSVLPAEVFEVLGRAPMANRQQVHLLRCGVKLLLVSVTPAGTETLTEITDAPEVDRLAGLCRQAKPGSATEAFRQVFEQFAPHDPQPGVLSRLLGGSRGRAEPWQGGEPTQGMGDRLENRDV